MNGTLLIASSDALEALQLVQAILSNLVRRSRFCGGIAPPMLRMLRKRRSFHIAPALGLVKLKNHAPAHVHGLDRERLDSGLSPRTVQYVHTISPEHFRSLQVFWERAWKDSNLRLAV